MANPEAKLVRKIIQALREEFPEGYFRKIHGNMFQHAGIPDIIGCVRRRFIGLEVKTSTGRLSKIQEIEGGEIIISRGIYGTPTTPEEAVEIVRKGLTRTKLRETKD